MGILYRLIRRGLGGAAAWALTCDAALAACAADRVDIRGDFGKAQFRVELALTTEEQARGLMFREELARMAGMLFVYPRTQEVGFWMRNTLIPLDMIFADRKGIVRYVHHERRRWASTRATSCARP